MASDQFPSVDEIDVVILARLGATRRIESRQSALSVEAEASQKQGNNENLAERGYSLKFHQPLHSGSG